MANMTSSKSFSSISSAQARSPSPVRNKWRESTSPPPNIKSPSLSLIQRYKTNQNNTGRAHSTDLFLAVMCPVDRPHLQEDQAHPPFKRTPYLGWRSSERLSKDLRSTSPTSSHLLQGCS